MLSLLRKFVKRVGKTKMERAIELFEHAVSMAPSDAVCQDLIRLYLQYAKLEKDYGLAKQAMKVYEEATKKVPECQRVEICDIYISRAAEILLIQGPTQNSVFVNFDVFKGFSPHSWLSNKCFEI
ncbi:hypothetical protein Bca101_076794 [Brassica carinata]